MLIYDVTNTATFDSLQDWLELARIGLSGKKLYNKISNASTVLRSLDNKGRVWLLFVDA